MAEERKEISKESGRRFQFCRNIDDPSVISQNLFQTFSVLNQRYSQIQSNLRINDNHKFREMNGLHIIQLQRIDWALLTFRMPQGDPSASGANLVTSPPPLVVQNRLSHLPYRLN